MNKPALALFHKLKEFSNALFNRKCKRVVHASHCNLNFNETKTEFPNNEVSTGIYNAFNFVPKSLAFQFSRAVNIYFLVVAVLQIFKPISTTGGKPIGLFPLGMIIAISCIKELVEDLKRHKSDRIENSKKVLVNKDGKFVESRWGDLRVGQIIKVHDDEIIPADILLLNTSLKKGLCFVETMNLDGETALKSKYVQKDLLPEMNTEEKIINAKNSFNYERPNEYLYKFLGCVDTPNGRVAMNEQNFVLRGCTLKNTGYIYGVVTYTGHSTKIMLNSTNSKAKISKLEKDMGRQILNVFIMQFILCFFATIYATSWFQINHEDLHYLDSKSSGGNGGSILYGFVTILGSWILLLSRYVPISLIVNIELVKIIQSIFINNDPELYYPVHNIQASVNSPTLTEELGQVEYVLTDKTGTLTKNMMNFKKISIGGELYGEKICFGHCDETKVAKIPHVDFYDPKIVEDLANTTSKNHQRVKETIILLAVCHTAMVQEKDGQQTYNTASPDELALVNFAKYLGIEFKGIDENENINITYKGKLLQYKLLHVFEFNSDRKRMSVIIRTPEGTIMLYTKGADSVLLERMDNNDTDNDYYILLAHHHLQQFATQGLRTLVLAKKEIEEDFYPKWKKRYEAAQELITGRDQAMEDLQSELEDELKILGVSAVEDKLQDEVACTIAQLREVGIKVWMLTGDKVETAINIGYSCRVLDDSMTQLQLIEKTNDDVTNALERMITQVNSQDCSKKFALIVSGDAMVYATKHPLSQKLLNVAKQCQVVIACRVSPKQKQQFVVMLKEDDPKVTTLAIGDGANDVYMITAASVGVGICGLEGNQAARTSDFAIGEFRLLKRLLFYHGRENYRRNSYLIIYNFYKNILFASTFFWFGFFSGFSGTRIFDKFLMEFYNTLFTSVPIIVYATCDHEFTPEFLVSNPRLYIQGMKSKIFNKKRFGQWVLMGFIASAFITICALYNYDNKDSSHKNGKHSGMYGVGMFLYAAIVWSANTKILAITHTYNTMTFLFGIGCTMAFVGCFILASHFTFTDVYSFAAPVFFSWDFYALLFILTIPSVLATLGWKIYRHLTNPLIDHKDQLLTKRFAKIYPEISTPSNQHLAEVNSDSDTPSNISVTPSHLPSTPKRTTSSPSQYWRADVR